MKSVIVPLFSNTNRYKGDIEIYPLSICGMRDFNTRGQVAESHGCQPDNHHAAAGGRYQKVIDVPEGYRLETLTSGETASVYEALGETANDFMTEATVHGTWKIRCNQGAVLVKETKRF